jgi:hypothetical protein
VRGEWLGVSGGALVVSFVIGGIEGWGLADDFRPGLASCEDEFGFGELLGLQHELSDVGEGLGGSGLDVALSGSAKKGGEGTAQVAGGEDIGFEETGDLAAGFAGFGTRLKLFAMMEAKAEVVGELGKSAAAAVGIGEMTQVGTIGITWHEILRDSALSCQFSVHKLEERGEMATGAPTLRETGCVAQQTETLWQSSYHMSIVFCSNRSAEFLTFDSKSEST